MYLCSGLPCVLPCFSLFLDYCLGLNKLHLDLHCFPEYSVTHNVFHLLDSKEVFDFACLITELISVLNKSIE